MITAEEACADYEFWAAGIVRLTRAIADEVCPDKSVMAIRESCFTEARQQLCGADFGDRGDPNRPATLAEIEETVKDCESCVRLIGFIRERKHARQRFGVAKRQIRVVGKRHRRDG